MLKILLNLFTHGFVLFVGIAIGIYILPILTASQPPSMFRMQDTAGEFVHYASFVRELEDSDWLHWGEGELSLSRSHIVFQGQLAPGPDYRLYLSPEYLETEEAFEAIRPRMRYVGDVKSFENFIVALPAGVDLEQYSTVVIWCEAFGQFITAARYR